MTGHLVLHAEIERWPLLKPFRITGFTWEIVEVLRVTLGRDGQVGEGEAAGVYYKQGTVATMLAQVEAIRPAIEAGVDRSGLQRMLPPGGARNALDCALWDLEAKLSSRPVWEIAGLEKPRALMTTYTCGADTPENMAAAARSYTNARAIKLKLTGDMSDPDRVQAVREERKDVWLGIDANQGFTRASLDRLMPTLIEARVSLVEQPFPVGQESLLDDFHSPIPIAADESVQSLIDLPALVGRFNIVNIKLDKCGGLTEGLAMARACHALGFDTMVGNMMGTSLAMAPAFILGQLCTVVDLDGPVFLRADRADAVKYTDGFITCRDMSWGEAFPVA